MSTIYSMIEAPDGTFAVLVTLPARGTYVSVTRPVAAYFNAKAAQAYVDAFNGNDPKRGRMRPPIEYRFAVPDWWTAMHPNWDKGE